MPRAPRVKMQDKSEGRAKLTIDWDTVDNLLLSGCTGVEIAANIGVSPDTLYDRCIAKYGVTFTSYSQEKRSKGEGLLRAKQYQHAMKGNTTMMVWLGKNRLGQRDTPKEIDVSKESLDAFTAIMEQLKESQDD